jgi:CDP-diacylglycerol---glycerol-3-phosphate 3-phosphatidyltransferase
MKRVKRKVKSLINVPNVLTLGRILAIPIFVILFYLPYPGMHFLATLVFLFAALTDWFDGYLARLLKQTTKFGAFLDPVADKLMITTALVLVVAEFGAAYLALPAAVIVGREIVISALREWMAEIGKRTSIAVTKITKVKTTLQMAALTFLLLYRPGNTELWRYLGIILIYIAAILTLWSMIMYLKTAWPDLTLTKDK